MDCCGFVRCDKGKPAGWKCYYINMVVCKPRKLFQVDSLSNVCVCVCVPQFLSVGAEVGVGIQSDIAVLSRLDLVIEVFPIFHQCRERERGREKERDCHPS